MGKLIINGNQVYEIDEECMKKKRKEIIEAKTVQKTYGQNKADKRQMRR